MIKTSKILKKKEKYEDDMAFISLFYKILVKKTFFVHKKKINQREIPDTFIQNFPLFFF